MIRVLHLFLLFWLLIASPLLSYSADVRVDESIRYTLKGGRNGKWKLTARVRERVAYLSTPSLQRTKFVIVQPGGTHISGVSLWANGQLLHGDLVVNGPAIDRDIFLSDTRIFYLYFPGQYKIGDSVAYEYSQEFDDVALLPILIIPNENYLHGIGVTFEHPPEVLVTAELFDPRGEIVLRTDQPTERTTVFTIDSMPQAPPLAAYDWDGQHGAAIFKVTADGRPVNGVTPAGLCGWYGTHVNLSPVADSTAKAVVSPELAGALTAIDSVRAIAGWVQKNIRYIADHSEGHAYIPHDPAVTMTRRYGDCKDRAYLLSALAGGFGLSVWQGLVSTETMPTFSWVHPSLFDHVINAFGEGDSLWFMDATDRYLPSGQLSGALEEKPLFILEPANPRYVTARSRAAVSRATTLIDTRIDSLAHSRVAITLTGTMAASACRFLDNRNGDSEQEWLYRWLAPRFRQMQFQSASIAVLPDSTVQVTAQADLTKFVVATPSSRYAPKVAFDFGEGDLISRAADSLPLHLAWPGELQVTINLRGATLDTGQVDLAVNDGVAVRYRATARAVNDSTVVLQYAMGSIAKTLTGAAKSDYLTFYRKLLAAQSALFSFKEKRQ